MYRRVPKHAVQLKMLRDATPSLPKQIMHHCGKKFLNCVCECVKNVLKGNVPLTSQKQNLSRRRNKLRKQFEKDFEEKEDRNYSERWISGRIDNAYLVNIGRITRLEETS